MPDAVIDSLRVRGRCPHGLGDAAAHRLRRALDAAPAALSDAFAELAEVDPGAYWVLREVRTRVSVPAGEPDAGRQARRVAEGLAESVEAIVRRGPGADAVRFAGRPDYVAAYVRARLSATEPGWVFARLATFSALAVGDALIAAARALEVTLADAVVALAAPGAGWDRLVPVLDAAQAVRLASALGRDLADTSPTRRALARAARARAERLAATGRPPVGASGGGAFALLLIAELAASGPVDSGDLAAVLAVSRTPDRPVAASLGPGLEPDAGPEVPGAEVADEADAPESAGRPVAGPRSFVSAGCVAFVLLPDLDELLSRAPELAAPGPAPAAVRARILAGMFAGAVDADDPAVALASGLVREPDPAAVAALLAVPASALADALASEPLSFVHPTDAGRFGGDPAGRLSAALLRRFAGHLAGFGLASAAHLIPRVLPPGGRVTAFDDVLDVALPPVPLGVLLALAGLDGFVCRPPWLDVRVLVSHEAIR